MAATPIATSVAHVAARRDRVDADEQHGGSCAVGSPATVRTTTATSLISSTARGACRRK